MSKFIFKIRVGIFCSPIVVRPDSPIEVGASPAAGMYHNFVFSNIGNNTKYKLFDAATFPSAAPRVGSCSDESHLVDLAFTITYTH